MGFHELDYFRSQLPAPKLRDSQATLVVPFLKHRYFTIQAKINILCMVYNTPKTMQIVQNLSAKMTKYIQSSYLIT